MKVLEKILQEYSNYEFIDIKDILEKKGFSIIEWDLGKIDGILFNDKIGINKKLKKSKKRFVLAHEYCHFLLKEKSLSIGIYNSLDFIEKRADKFATDLLLPEKSFLENWEKFQNIPTMAKIFGVPKKVVEMRLNNLIK